MNFRRRLIKKGNGAGFVTWWCRGLTDDLVHFKNLKAEMEAFNNVGMIELLPYYTMGSSKYKGLGLSYRLTGLEPMSRKEGTYKKGIEQVFYGKLTI